MGVFYLRLRQLERSAKVRKASKLCITGILCQSENICMMFFCLHIFAGKPEVFVYPDRVVVAEGDDVEVSCNASGTPYPTLTWNRLLGNRPKNMVVSRNGVMKIRRVKMSESGIYQCTAENIVGSSSRPSFIVIMRSKLFA